MPRTITLSDAAYARLEAEARARGLLTVEELLSTPQPARGTDSTDTFARTRQIQQRLSQKYGIMRDSVDYLREDRER